tara:strand:- start:1945 stop:2874 length:930 start_codon:yes stop_codon:yes gene_type:complete
MIFRFKLYLIWFFLISSSFVYSQENVFIQLKVNDNIITNIDIKKEAKYLEVLNPNISELEYSKILNIAKKSIIKEIIKRNEILKFFVLEDKEFIEHKLLDDLISKLNLSNDEFENLLSDKKSYSIDEIKRKLKTDILWNDLIYYKFKDQIRIDKVKLEIKIDEFKSSQKKEYLLSEIIFEKRQDQNLNEYYNKIRESIQEIGFKNSANIYSIAESSKFGGKIGWINENNLSKIIVEKLKNLEKGQFTEMIKVGNNYLLLMVNEIRLTKIEINREEELNKLIKFETNRQLNQFSKIYFSKVSANYFIDEK